MNEESDRGLAPQIYGGGCKAPVTWSQTTDLCSYLDWKPEDKPFELCLELILIPLYCR